MASSRCFSGPVALMLLLPITPPTLLAQTHRDTFEDPFAYCQAVGTADSPGRRYLGPPMTDVIARGLQRVFAIDSIEIPRSLLLNSMWRCMDGQVYACHRGANLPCETRANLDRTPTPGLITYCRDNPETDYLPMAITGRTTVYQWRCEGGKALAGEAFVEPDSRGFLEGLWHRIPPPTGASE